MKTRKLKRHIARIRYYSYLIIKGHILNPFWKGHDARRRNRYNATIKAVGAYLRLYEAEVKEMNPETEKSKESEEKVFTIWFQGEANAPEIVKSCIRSMRRHLTQELVVLDEKNIFDWITLPEIIVKKWRSGKITHTAFSDICRVELLHRHGGIWMDATDFMTASIPEYVMNSDFFVFKTGDSIGKWFSYIESCFIRAKKGNRLLAMWRELMILYWKEENSAIDYFVNLMMLRYIVENNATAAEEFERMPKVDHSQIIDFWRYHGDEQYDAEKFDKMTSNSFFKKTSYHTKSATATKKGSNAEYMINLK